MRDLIGKLRAFAPYASPNAADLMHEAADALEAKAAPVGEREAFEKEWQRIVIDEANTPEKHKAFVCFSLGAAYQRQSGVVMPESVGVLILGGIFHGGSGPELGDIDIELDMRVLERIQMELVTSSDDVHLELFARLNGAGSHE